MNVYERLAFGFIYSSVYVFLSIDLLGAGHGTIFFLIPLVAWLPLLVAILCLTPTPSAKVEAAFIILLSAHELISLLLSVGYLLSGDNGRLASTLELYPYYCAFTAAWYFLGQLVMWWLFTRTRSHSKALP